MTLPITVKIRIAGIPAQARVTRFQRHRGTFSRFAPDPDTYSGWLEMDYKLLDENGHKGSLLELVADREDLWEEVEEQVAEEAQETIQALKEDHEIQKRKDREI